MSFQLLLQPRFYIFLLHSQNEGNLMPPCPPPPCNWKRSTVTNTSRIRVVRKILGFFLLLITNLNFSTIIPLVRSYYIFSKIWIRLLSLSHTTFLPSLRFAVEYGNFNSPLSLPSLPNFVTNFPLSSNN